MIALFAGRAVEETIYDQVSTGAADDLAKAADVVQQCVTHFGMDSSVAQAILEEQKLQWLGDGHANARQRDYLCDPPRSRSPRAGDDRRGLCGGKGAAAGPDRRP